MRPDEDDGSHIRRITKIVTMDSAPSRERLNALLVSIRDEQVKIRNVIGPPKAFQQSMAMKLEPLKTPIYVMWQYLGYGDFPDSKEQRIWLASFKTSPPDYLSECITQIKNGDIPVDDLTLRRQLIDFYSEMTEKFEQ